MNFVEDHALFDKISKDETPLVVNLHPRRMFAYLEENPPYSHYTKPSAEKIKAFRAFTYSAKDPEVEQFVPKEYE